MKANRMITIIRAAGSAERPVIEGAAMTAFDRELLAEARTFAEAELPGLKYYIALAETAQCRRALQALAEGRQPEIEPYSILHP